MHINECCAYYDCTAPRIEVLRGMFQAGVMTPEEIMAQGSEWDPAKNAIRQNDDYPVRPHLVGSFFFDIVKEYSDKERMPVGPDMSFVHAALAACPDAKQETKFLNKMHRRSTRAAVADSMVEKGFSVYQTMIIDKLFDKTYPLGVLSRINGLLSNPEPAAAKKEPVAAKKEAPGSASRKRERHETSASVRNKAARRYESDVDANVMEEKDDIQLVSQDCDDTDDAGVVEL